MEPRKRLISLGAEALADELLRLSSRSDAVQTAVERLVATPTERLKRYKSSLAGLRRTRRFVDWSGSRQLAEKLESILEELRSSGCDPKTGVDLTSRFLECDKSVLERCDDSSGQVGDAFRINAQDLWVEYASQCEEKDWVADRVFELCMDDDYGVRDGLLQAGSKYLPEQHLRRLADRFWKQSEASAVDSSESDSFRDRSGYRLSAAVARAIGDPVLFEKAILAYGGGQVGRLSLEIAEVYLDANSPTGALRWLEDKALSGRVQGYELDPLRLRAYEQLGSRSKQASVAKRIFDGHATIKNLDQLVAIVGDDQREGFIEDAAQRIERGELDLTGAQFLIDVGRVEDAGRHLVAHRSEINGRYYPSLLNLAKQLEREGQLLSTVCIYRALLESILARAVSKYYGHGVRYLKKLDQLGTEVREWGLVEPHLPYRTRLLEQHKRKRSFWAKVGDGA